MPVRNLNKIFRPQSVAVIGASDQPGKVGHTLLQNLRTGGRANSQCLRFANVQHPRSCRPFVYVSDCVRQKPGDAVRNAA